MKQLAIFILFVFLFTDIHAQEKKFVIRTGIGYLSDAHFQEALVNGVGTFFISFFAKHDFRITTTGVYSGDILYRLPDKKMQVGLSYDVENLRVTEYETNSTTFYKRNANTILAEGHNNYITGRNVNLYSGVGLGVNITNFSGDHTEKNFTHLAYHFTFLGFSYGKTVGVFSEVGWGAKGLVRGGVSVAF